MSRQNIDQKLDYIELPATNFDAVEQFYSTAFNWQFVDYGSQYRAFHDHKLDGGFYQSPLVSSPDTGGALVIIYALDLESTRERVVAAGGSISRDIFSFPGGRRFQFRDPHGNELGVWSDQTLRPEPT